MGLYKLREWVGTVTGKGDRWVGTLGRSEPAFLRASTTALPPSTCTARREAGHLWLFVLRPVPGGESAGCVRLQWLFCRLCACSPFAMSCPLPPTFLPPFICFVCPCSFHVRQDHHCKSTNMFASCKTVPLTAATRACSGGPCAGSI